MRTLLSNFFCTMLVVMCLLPVSASSQSGRSTGADHLKFTLTDNFLIILKVKVNGTEKNFIVDTGSTTSVISTELANEMQLSTIGKTNLITSSGESKVSWSKVNLQIGSRLVPQSPVIVTDISAIKNHSEDVEGVLGNDVLSQWNYLISYQESVFEIEKGDEIGAKIAGELIPFRLVEGRMAVTAKNQYDEKFLLIVDTALVKPVTFTDELPKTNNEKVYTVGGTSDFEDAKFIWNIGTGVKFNGDGLKIKRMNRIENGLLPTNLFKQIYVNNRYKVLMFD